MSGDITKALRVAQDGVFQTIAGMQKVIVDGPVPSVVTDDDEPTDVPKMPEITDGLVQAQLLKIRPVLPWTNNIQNTCNDHGMQLFPTRTYL